jgi:membrane-associated protein
MLFPIAVLDGPIVTVIVGFLCKLGVLNPLVAYPIIVVADGIGDSIYYSLGRWGRGKYFEKVINWLGLTPSRLERMRGYLGSNAVKMISVSKVVLGVGVAGLFLAGRSGMVYSRYILICFCTSLVQCAVYLTIGYFFGAFYQEIGHYLDFFGVLILVVFLAVVAYLIITSKMKKV